MVYYVGVLQECDAEDYGPGRILRVDIFDSLDKALDFKQKFNEDYITGVDLNNNCKEFLDNTRGLGYTQPSVWSMYGGNGYNVFEVSNG